ncbi:unnamed protein product [Symbiodinium sp. KB8]|nr:unnamed protein product [Symbiodinium sp. KB8]
MKIVEILRPEVEKRLADLREKDGTAAGDLDDVSVEELDGPEIFEIDSVASDAEVPGAPENLDVEVTDDSPIAADDCPAAATKDATKLSDLDVEVDATAPVSCNRNTGTNGAFKDRQPLLPKGNLPFNFEVAMSLEVSSGEIRDEQEQAQKKLAAKNPKKRHGEDELDGEAKRARVQDTMLSLSGAAIENATVPEESGPAVQNAILPEESGPAVENAIVSEEPGPSSENAILSDESGPSGENAIVSEESGPAIVSEESGPAIENAIVSEESGPHAVQNAMVSEESGLSGENAAIPDPPAGLAAAPENLRWLNVQAGVSDCCPASGPVDPSELKTLSYVVPAPPNLVQLDPKKYKSITVVLNNKAFYVNNSWVPCPGVKATWYNLYVDKKRGSSLKWSRGELRHV